MVIDNGNIDRSSNPFGVAFRVIVSRPGLLVLCLVLFAFAFPCHLARREGRDWVSRATGRIVLCRSALVASAPGLRRREIHGTGGFPPFRCPGLRVGAACADEGQCHVKARELFSVFRLRQPSG